MKYVELRKQVVELALDQRYKYGMIVTSEIARKLGISESQVVHILEKEGYIK